MTVKTIHAAIAVVVLAVSFGRAYGAEPEAAEHRDVVLEERGFDCSGAGVSGGGTTLFPFSCAA